MDAVVKNGVCPRFIWWVAAAMVMLPLAAAQAQQFPVKPVRFIIPFPPGGPTDILGRLAAERLARTWNVQVIADNRPGGGGHIRHQEGAKPPGRGGKLGPRPGPKTPRRRLYDLHDLDRAEHFAVDLPEARLRPGQGF